MDLLVLFHEYILGEGLELEYYYQACGKRSTEIIMLLWYSFLDAYKSDKFLSEMALIWIYIG